MEGENLNIDPKYVNNVYNALKKTVPDFDKSPEEFKESLKSKQYVSNVHGALKKVVPEFDKDLKTFESLVYENPIQKKNQVGSGSSTSKKTPSVSTSKVAPTTSLDGGKTQPVVGSEFSVGGNKTGFKGIGLPAEKEANKENRRLNLKWEVGTAKVTSKNMDEISAKSKELDILNAEKTNKVIKQGADEIKKEKESSGLMDFAVSGSAGAMSAVARLPELIFDINQAGSRKLSDAFGIGHGTSDYNAKQVMEKLGITNDVADELDKVVKSSNEKIEAYNAKNGGDVIGALSNQNYLGAAKMIAGSTLQSAPLMVAAMATGGGAAALATIGAVSASMTYADLQKENPEMDQDVKLASAVGSGLLEAYVGKFFSGASGAAARRILVENGAEAGAKIIAKGFKGMAMEAIEKSPVVGLVGEVIEESSVELGNQLIAMSNGTRKELDMRQIYNAGLTSTGMGGVNTVAVYGAKGYVKASEYKKSREINKQISSLSNELSNPNLSDSDKRILASRVDKLILENKKTIGDGLNKIKALPNDVKTEIVDINGKLEGFRDKVIELEDNFVMTPETKDALITEIKSNVKELTDRKLKIIEGTYVQDDFNKLSDAEKIQRKDKASRELLNEAQAKGEEKASFDDAQITKKAIEDYGTERKQKSDRESTNQEEPTGDQTTTEPTQPTAETGEGVRGVQEEVDKTSPTPQKAIIPEKHREDVDFQISSQQENLDIGKGLLEEERAKGFLTRNRGVIKGLENDVKFYEDNLRLINEDPVKFYENFIDSSKIEHNNRVKQDKAFKKELIKEYGTTDFETYYAGWIQDTKNKIEDLKKANEVKPTTPESTITSKSVESPTSKESLPPAPEVKTEEVKGTPNVVSEPINLEVPKVEEKVVVREVDSNEEYESSNKKLISNIWSLRDKRDKLKINSKERNLIEQEMVKAEAILEEFRDKNKDLILEHGTPHDFEKFDLDKIGTGEGNQAFGYGLYFTEDSKIAKSYASKLSDDKTGVVYKVKIKDGRQKEWLEWREAIDESQTERLQEVVRSKKSDYDEYLNNTSEDNSHTGAAEVLFNPDLSMDERPLQAGAVYADLRDAFGQQEATRIMKEAGFEGVKYRTKKGRGDNFNYVIFDSNSIVVESKSTKPTTTETPIVETPKESKARQTLVEKTKNAENELKDAWKNLSNLGAIYDPKIQAEKQVAMNKAIVKFVVNKIALGAYDVSTFIKDMATNGIELTKEGADFLFDKSQKSYKTQVNRLAGPTRKPTVSTRKTQVPDEKLNEAKTKTKEAQSKLKETNEELKDAKAQLKSVFNASLEAVKQVKNRAEKNSKVRFEIGGAIESFKGKGKITQAQAAVMSKKLAGLDVEDLDAVEDFMNQVDDVFKRSDYYEKVSTAKKDAKSLKTASNNKEKDNTTRTVAKELASLDPSILDADKTLGVDSEGNISIDEHIEMLNKASEGLKQTTKTTKEGGGTLIQRRALNVNEVLDYIEKFKAFELKKAKEKYKEVFKKEPDNDLTSSEINTKISEYNSLKTTYKRLIKASKGEMTSKEIKSLNEEVNAMSAEYLSEFLFDEKDVDSEEEFSRRYAEEVRGVLIYAQKDAEKALLRNTHPLTGSD